ncbi:MAG: hypothetical protein HFF93_08600 [Oscillibacter sp.]|nr:hypothetical protein [Oscillibacter sp.]
MSYASAAALPGGLTLNSTDFTRNVSEGAYKLRVSGGTGTYTWISENPSIATVGSDGTITPVAAGITNVVVTDGSKRAICIVRVTGGSAPSGDHLHRRGRRDHHRLYEGRVPGKRLRQNGIPGRFPSGDVSCIRQRVML